MSFLEKCFHLSEKGTTVKTEIVAGITTFLAMAYILGVNPMILADAGMDKNAVFMATALASAVACFLMGFLANYPVALSAGMGVNALFAYTVCGAMGYSWQAALAAVFVSGLVFVLISVTGIRKKIIDAIPVQLKLAIGAGIGFFIAFVGLKNCGLIIANASTFVGIGNLADPTVLLAVFGLIVTIVCVVRKIPAGVFVGLLLTALVGVVLGMMGMENMPAVTGVFTTSFEMNAAGAFVQGFGELFANPMNALVVIFSFLFVDFFDTAGTLVAVGTRAGLVDQKGHLVNGDKALLADSSATVIGSVLGTSSTTSFVESLTGVEAGGRTGLTSVFTALCFLLMLFCSGLLSVVTSAITAPALITVGILMASSLGDIEWKNLETSIPSFVTIIMMVLGYSIAEGIASGFVLYPIMMLAARRQKEVHPVMWALMVIFFIHFVLA